MAGPYYIIYPFESSRALVRSMLLQLPISCFIHGRLAEAVRASGYGGLPNDIQRPIL